MTLTVKKGHHYSQWWKTFAIWFNKTEVKRVFFFRPDCKYDLLSDDQADHNKLFGIGYFWNKKESARIGWRWDPDLLRFILSGYAHVNGQILFEDFCEVIAHQTLQGIIRVLPYHYEFEVLTEDGSVQLGRTTIRKTHRKKLSYAMGFYFGGNRTAPHDMSIDIKKV
jgi:hypothetical protein